MYERPYIEITKLQFNLSSMASTLGGNLHKNHKVNLLSTTPKPAWPQAPFWQTVAMVISLRSLSKTLYPALRTSLTDVTFLHYMTKYADIPF